MEGGIGHKMEHFLNCYYAYTKLIPTDIYPVQYGEEQCERNHSFGPCIRNNYLLHYVYSGEGIFQVRGVEYPVKAGQMFLIRPHELTYYRADGEHPWLYRWMEFNGSMVPTLLENAGFTVEMPIRNDGKELHVGKALLDIVEGGDMGFALLMHKLWGFLMELSVEENTPSKSIAAEYIDKAESFIKINLHKRITVVDVAEYVGIDRSYLSRLFQTYKGVSPQQYILELKMTTAAYYLKNTDISIGEAAQSVGYGDSRVFNKAFKTLFQVSPSAWREKKLWEQYIIEDEIANRDKE